MNAKTALVCFALLLLKPATAGDTEPCVIPRGPPCITISELREREREGRCTFEEEACISLQWDEYTGTIITKAKVSVTPSCTDPARAPALEQQALAKLERLQTIPIETAREEKPCAEKAKVDIVITETSG